MTAVPPLLEAGLAAVLAASIWRAFFGPPPRTTDTVAAAAWMTAGVALLATVLIAGQAADPRDILTAAGVEAICVAGWWLRRREDEGPSHPELDAPGEGGTDFPGIDWGEFDRLRAGWRPREPV
jgi:hypothetical protein